jgi:hypothetical protein
MLIIIEGAVLCSTGVQILQFYFHNLCGVTSPSRTEINSLPKKNCRILVAPPPWHHRPGLVLLMSTVFLGHLTCQQYIAPANLGYAA